MQNFAILILNVEMEPITNVKKIIAANFPEDLVELDTRGSVATGASYENMNLLEHVVKGLCLTSAKG
jgi:hypothetical protein